MGIRQPKYRFHKARNCAVVTIQGTDHYLGKHGSPESWENYHRLVAEWMASHHNPPPDRVAPNAPLTIVELIAHYWRFVKAFYIKDGKPTSEVDTIKQALRFLRRLYGSTPACEFSPKKLKAVREAMITHKVIRRQKMRDAETGKVIVDPKTGKALWEQKVVRSGLARRYINQQISRIKRCFGWAVEEEFVGVEVHAALLRVKGLRRGKSAAREKPRIRPVLGAHIDAVLPVVPPIIEKMIRLQLLCGGRPQDIVGMCAQDIDRSGPVWEYRPRRYKTEHHNDGADMDLERVIYLGPIAQNILEPLLREQAVGYLFSPIRAERERNAKRKENRKSPMTPSQAARRPRGRSKAPLREQYDVASYRRAIRRACQKVNIPVWHPNQLRHTRLTEIRKRFGLEASRVCGGHREFSVTQHYAEQDRELARQVMVEIG